VTGRKAFQGTALGAESLSREGVMELKSYKERRMLSWWFELSFP
jgi:hypothetical protein